MTGIAIVGTQWGDEGKGKVVDWLSERADVVVRFQGGHNAGHTLVIAGDEFRLSILPSGVMRPSTVSAIGGGVVIDPWTLAEEIDALEARGVEVPPARLRIAETAALILPVHQELDQLREERAGAAKIGTTGRGIGPAYEDRVGRRAVRVADLANPDATARAVDRLLGHHQPLREGLGAGPADRATLIERLLGIAPRITPYSAPLWRELASWRRAKARILFEGAQGSLLDVEHGTYPYVTSSSTVAGQAAVGAGVGPQSVGYVLGVAKAYATRVGSGPFPTELRDEIGERFGERGREFGTVTGRRRRCGWLDAVLLRQAIEVSGVDAIALTKIDVLDGLECVRICVGYELDGAPVDRFPAAAGDEARLRPVYEELPGWSAPTAGARSWDDFPSEVVRFVGRLEELAGRPVGLISTSPERDDMIVIRDPFSGS